MFRSSLLAAVVLTSAALAQDATIPEIEGPRAAYHRALAQIRSERDTQAAPSRRTYAERLEDLKVRLTDEGDSKSAEAVQREIDRLAKGTEPTSEERRKMTGLLLALRVGYEKSRSPAYMAARTKEAQAQAEWATGLGQLEQHLTRLRQLDKVTVVKAERARVAQATAAAANAAAIAPMPVETSGLKLDSTLANKIRAAIEQKKVIKSALAGDKPGPPNVPDDGAVLIGFELSEFPWKGTLSVKALDPIFLTAEGVFRGVLRGKHSKTRSVVQAPEGYAVGALKVFTKERISGLQIVFMKMDLASGKLNPEQKFETKWYGTKGDGEPTQIGGDGHIPVGVHGFHENAARTIGLMFLP